MKPPGIHCILSLLDFSWCITAALTQGGGGTATPTKSSTSLTAPWDNPTHSPSTFTTISLTCSDDAQGTEAVGRRYDCIEEGLARIAVAHSREFLTTFQVYATITITIPVDGFATAVLYTGTVDVQSMVTVTEGTHTVTEGIEITVTDLAVKTSTVIVTPVNNPTGANFLDPYDASSNTPNATHSGNARATAQPGLPSIPSTETCGTAPTLATTFSGQTPQTATTSVSGIISYSIKDLASSTVIGTESSTTTQSSITTESPTTTFSTAGAASTATKAAGALVGLFGAAIFAL